MNEEESESEHDNSFKKFLVLFCFVFLKGCRDSLEFIRACFALTEDLGSVSSIHVVDYNDL